MALDLDLKAIESCCPSAIKPAFLSDDHFELLNLRPATGTRNSWCDFRRTTLLTAYKQILVSKRLEVSQTAIEIINGRWTMHVFGLRKDEATAEPISVLPNTSKLGLWLVLWPLWVKARVVGQSLLYPRSPNAGDETIADMVPARTTHFDAMIARAIKEVNQFVLLGAGNSPNQRLSAVFKSSLFRSPTIDYRRYLLFLYDEHSTFWIMLYKA